MVHPVCAAEGGGEFKPIRTGCEVNLPEAVRGEEHGKRYVRLAYPVIEGTPDHAGTYVPFAHYNCTHNQLRAIRNRVIAEVPKPSPHGMKQLYKQARRICKLLPVTTPNDYGVMPNSYSGAKRTKYLRAENFVREGGGVKVKDSRVKMFVKFEKISPTKVNPDPRAIQFRDPKYCVEVARYLKPIEHYLYELKGDGSVLPNSRLIAKGLNSYERAMLLKRKIDGFLDPIILSLDASRFDLHVSKELLQLEHFVYKDMCNDPYFAQLLAMQLINKGRTDTGITYTCVGGRMSGDMNTALGNCLLMVIMVSTFMHGRKYDILDDGDDCLLIVERSELEWVKNNIKNVFLTYGHEMKIESITSCLSGVEFCQSKVIEYEPGKYKFVRNPFKMMSSALSGTRYFNDSGGTNKLVNTIGLAELILNAGVPISQEYALALMRNAACDQIVKLQEFDSTYYRLNRELKLFNLKHLAKIDPPKITDQARETFAEAFGVSVTEQLRYEKSLREWRFNLAGREQMPQEWDVANWIWCPSHSPEAYAL